MDLQVAKWTSTESPVTPDVAVLLATYNGSRFVAQQLDSLKQNDSSFTLHWIDDHSTDDTREIVRTSASRSGLKLVEWHQPYHLGVPAAFFELLERVEADIYLFCDQDDIWQRAKIDTAVEFLKSRLESPSLCCSDFFMFRTGAPEALYSFFDLAAVRSDPVLPTTKPFLTEVANGHTQAFTRPLRNYFVTHKEVAREYAYMHDEWMHSIAVATGEVHVLPGVPTTLYRYHGSNASAAFGGWVGQGSGRFTSTWEQRRRFRRALARHAEGIILASPTLPPGPRLERALEIARLVASLDRRQSPAALLRLLRYRILWSNWRLAFWLAVACLSSDARVAT